MMLNPAVTRASIANIETGKQRILAHTLFQLANALEVDLADIVPADNFKKEVAQKPQVSSEKIVSELTEKLPLSPTEIEKLAAKMNKPKKVRK